MQKLSAVSVPSLQASIAKSETKKKVPKKLAADKKKLSIIEKFVDPATPVPFFCRVMLKKVDGVKKPVSFHPAKASNAHEQARELLSEVLGRKVSWYDGRKSGVNLITFFTNAKVYFVEKVTLLWQENWCRCYRGCTCATVNAQHYRMSQVSLSPKYWS